MYTYVRALARTKGGNGTWNNVDISTLPLYQVYATYSSIKAILTNPVITGQMTVDFDDLPEALRVLTISFPEWLVSIGNKTLPVTYSVPSEEATAVRHIDAWYWNFQIKPANHLKNPDAQMLHDEQVDLFVKKEGVDPLELQKYCIATVNGMTHRLSSSTEGTFIIGGCTSGRLAKDNQVGFLDFSGLGDIDTVSLSSTQITRPVDDLPLTDSVYLNVGQSMLGKTVFLSFGGYFFPLSDAYDVVADKVLKVNTRLMDLIGRYYESREFVDWSSVFVPYQADKLPDRVVREAFETDATIEAILDMPQSFIVILDAVDIDVTYRALDKTQLPGVYVAHETEPVAPVVVNYGRLPEYMAVKEVNQYVVKIQSYMRRDPQRENVSMADLVVYEDASRTPQPNRYSDARLMMIQKIELVTTA